MICKDCREFKVTTIDPCGHSETSYQPRCDLCGATHKLVWVQKHRALLCKTCRSK